MPSPKILRCLALIAAVFLSGAAFAAGNLRLLVAGDDAELARDLRAASLVIAAFDEKRTDPREIFGAALSDYRNLVETLYANGYYGGVVHIRINGREAAEFPLLDVPERIDEIVLRVDPGRPFRFGKVEIGPVPRGANVPVPRPGERARSGLVRDAVKASVDAWRAVGHAKARPASQTVLADHAAATLSARIVIDPGARYRFGNLVLKSPSAVRADRIRRIAGFPSGTVFSPETLKTVATRLRRTGAFSSVVLEEADAPGGGDRLDVALTVVDEKPRRYGFGAELSSFEGARLSGYWLHRNFLGGAERLRVEAEAANIGGQAGAIDYSAGVRLESPAFFGPDTTAFAHAKVEHLDEPDFQSDQAQFGIGATRILSERLQVEAGLTLSYSETEDDIGARNFTLLSIPAKATWDRRDDPLDPVSGTYLAAELTPFVGLDGTTSGARGLIEGRAYRGFGAQDSLVFAGRLQIGSVVGPALTEVRPDFLFHSGGGNTVRGQPYQSLDVDLGGGITVGGRSFVGLSGELRASITERIGAVAFADAGYVGPESLYDGSGQWHAGAGLGLRYKTALGPIRLDIAAPVSGDTGDGIQLYLGIGQAF